MQGDTPRCCETGFCLPGSMKYTGGLALGQDQTTDPRRCIPLGTERSQYTYFSFGEVGKWKKRWVDGKVLICKGDFPLLAWRWKEPGVQDLRITYRTRVTPGQHPAGKRKPQSYNCEEMNLANGSNEVGSTLMPRTSRWELRWAKAWTWNLEQRILLRSSRTSNYITHDYGDKWVFLSC